MTEGGVFDCISQIGQDGRNGMEKINVEGIPEVMLQALRGRARESEREGHFLYDEKAVQTVKALDYDFSEMDKYAVMGRGPIAKAVLLDGLVKEYLERNPAAAIVDVACGIDTRFYRVDNGQLLWYNMDLPETIEARNRLLGSHERVRDIRKSVLDEGWAEEIETEGPVLFLVEGFTMYSNKQDVQKIFKIIRTHFKQADVLMEIMSPKVVKKAVDGAGKKKYTWGVKSARALQSYTTGFRAVREASLLEELKKMYPGYKFLQFVPGFRKMSNKIAVLHLETPEEKAGSAVKA